MRFSLTHYLLLILISIFFNQAYAKDYFSGKDGCYLLYDFEKNQLIATNDGKRCQKRVPPNSTFKVPLSVMAFDHHVINQETVFKWDGEKRFLPAWNQDQTPASWIKNSVVWVSQELTPKLGMDTIKKYLKKFHYGNQDFSGNPGKNDGLTEAWLNGSLKISAEEQLAFLKGLVANKLPVEQQAMINTKENMYIETSQDGWKFYGKTGSSPKLFGEGGFIGFVEKDNRHYLIVVNFVDLEPSEKNEYGGLRAKGIAKEVLKDHQLL